MAVSKIEVHVNAHRRETKEHGTALFPAACYYGRVRQRGIRWHWHEEWEVAVVESGNAIFSVEGRTYPCAVGEGIFINSSALHTMRAQPGTICGIRSVVFHPRLVGGSPDSIFWQSYVQPLLSNTGLKCVPLCAEEDWHSDAIRHISAAWTACAETADGFELSVRAALSQLAFLLVRHCAATQTQPTEKALRNEGRIRQMMTYIQENIQEELTITGIARSAAISESECLRCFRAMLGITPIQYVRQFRLQQAAEMLEHTDLKVSEVAALCGFQEMSYFSKLFREAKGCTPREYRQVRKTEV